MASFSSPLKRLAPLRSASAPDGKSSWMSSWKTSSSLAFDLTSEIEDIAHEVQVLQLDLARCDGNQYRLQREEKRLEDWLHKHQDSGNFASYRKAQADKEQVQRRLRRQEKAKQEIATKLRDLQAQLKELRGQQLAAFKSMSPSGRRRSVQHARALSHNPSLALIAGLPPSPALGRRGHNRTPISPETSGGKWGRVRQWIASARAISPTWPRRSRRKTGGDRC